MALRPVETTLVIALMCCWTHAGNPSSNPLECPPWYYTSSEDKCLFSETLSGVVNRFGNTSKIQIGFCIDQYHNNSTLVVVQCQYNPAPAGNNHNPGNYTTIYQILPEHVDQLNEAVCGPLNRRGYLCSECKENYGLAAYRYYGLLCVECTHTLWKSVVYTILLLLTTTASFLTFLLFNINVHSGNLTGFILFSHIIISTVSFFPSLIFLFGYWPIHILFSLYGVWSLNSLQFLIPPFCVSPHLTTLQLISLGYIPSLYVLLLCAVIFYLIEAHDKGNRTLIKAWKPFQRFLVKFKRPSNARFSVIYTFGTLVLLSYEKNLFITFTLLQGFVPVQLETTTNTLRTLPKGPILGLGACSLLCSGGCGRSTHCPAPTGPSPDLPNSCLSKTGPLLWSEEVAWSTHLHGSVHWYLQGWDSNSRRPRLSFHCMALFAGQDCDWTKLDETRSKHISGAVFSVAHYISTFHHWCSVGRFLQTSSQTLTQWSRRCLLTPICKVVFSFSLCFRNFHHRINSQSIGLCYPNRPGYTTGNSSDLFDLQTLVLGKLEETLLQSHWE